MNITVGTPPQQAQFIVDINSPYSYVFPVTLFDTPQEIDRFYDYRSSATSKKLDANEVSFPNNAVNMTGHFYSDTFCLLGTEPICYNSDFLLVTSITETLFKQYNMTNIGGVFGLGFNSTATFGNSLWLNTALEREFGIKLVPAPDDYSWLPDAPVFTGNSLLYVGGPNLNLINTMSIDHYPNSMTMLTSNVPNEWSVPTYEIAFYQLNTEQKVYN
jgi:hypothetical protein